MKLILFGAGYCGKEALFYFGRENVFCFCDNKVVENSEEELYGKKIISFQKLLEINKDYLIVICVRGNNGYHREIENQLDRAGIEYLSFITLQQMLTEKKIAVETFVEQIQSRIGYEWIYKEYFQMLLKQTKLQLDYLKRHTDIKTLRPATGRLRKRQLQLLDFARDFWEFAGEINIFPFLNFGNLIGAVRHQGFVPWDDDLDFGIMRDDYEKLITFARRKCITGTRCGEWGSSVWVDQSGAESDWNDVFQKFADRYICDIRSDMLQIFNKGKKGGQSIAIDVWVYDYYKNDYDIAEHKKWIERIATELQNLVSEKDKIEFLRKERENNPMVSSVKTDNIYPGIDNFGGYPGVKIMDRWIPSDYIFPLRKVKYEDEEFWAPNHMEGLLSFEYSDIMAFPDDMGVLHNGEWAE